MFSSLIIPALAALRTVGLAFGVQPALLDRLWREHEDTHRDIEQPPELDDKGRRVVAFADEAGQPERLWTQEQLIALIQQQVRPMFKANNQAVVGVFEALANPKARLEHEGPVEIRMNGANVDGSGGRFPSGFPLATDPFACPPAVVSIRNPDGFYQTSTGQVHWACTLRIEGPLVVAPGQAAPNSGDYVSNPIICGQLIASTIAAPFGGTHPIQTYFTTLSGYSGSGTLNFTIVNGTPTWAAASGSTIVLMYSQPNGTDVVSETESVFVAPTTGTITGVAVVPRDAPSGGDKGYTVDVKVASNGSNTYSTTLSGDETVAAGNADDTIVSPTINDGDLSVGDKIQVEVVASGTTGSQGQGLLVAITVELD